MSVTVHHGDMREVLARLIAEGVRVDSVVCDPPYHLTTGKKGGTGAASLNVNSPAGRARISTGFMGKAWDGGDIAFQPETWRLCYALLPPGGHLLAFSGTRTYHRMACAIEDAGFEIRDMVAWLYGTGFPKSLNVSKAIDKAAGVESEKVPRLRPDGRSTGYSGASFNASDVSMRAGPPVTDAARQWDGWGTALKPAWENICYAQKPYTEQQQTSTIGSTLEALEHQIWSLLPASDVLENFKSSQSEFDAACASAPWSADARSNTRAALSARMDMSQFVRATLSSLSTVQSWRACWADLSQPESTSTTETASSTTTDLRTWKSCLSRITPASIILAHKPGRWSSADAGPAERYLNASALSFNATRELSALANAIASDATNSPAEGALSPALEPICFARKPIDGTVAANVLKHGTGALNIEACRIATGEDLNGGTYSGDLRDPGPQRCLENQNRKRGIGEFAQPAGRWPANVVHDGSEEVLAAFPESDGAQRAVGPQFKPKTGTTVYGDYGPRPVVEPRGDSGSAARFFYSSKADADDRLGSKHPTVKPVDLMRWLVRLVTPKGGHVLDPFAGSGTTGMACMAEGFDCTLIEREAEYVADIRRRIAHVSGADAPLFAKVAAE